VAEQFALFKKLQPEFSKETGSNELFKIALLGGTLGYSIEERLAAYEKYSDLINSDRADKVYLDLRKLIESDVE
jgi:hypothetical protein